MTFPKKNGIYSGEYNAQSIAFGHRIKGDQTVDEYLLEFLQVLIAKKEIEQKEEESFFPELNLEKEYKEIVFKPKSRIDLKRFAFYKKAKMESRTQIDTDAYREIKGILEDRIESDSIKNKEFVDIMENLLASYSGVVKNRAWFAQSFLPMCRSMILPETMGDKKERKKLDCEYKKLDKSEEKCMFENLEINNELDTKFQTNRYNFMARGGEVYYLHLWRGILNNRELSNEFEEAMNKTLDAFNPIDELCDFIHKAWIEGDIHGNREENQYEKISKRLGMIPDDFGLRDRYAVMEITNLMKNSMHPFEKMDILAQGIVFQLVNLIHSEARYGIKDTRPAWVIDMTYSSIRDKEISKVAIKSYESFEDDVLKKIYSTLEQLEEKVENFDKALKSAIDDSYKVCRKLLKEIGVLVPISGKGMRLTFKENIIKFLVVSIIEPGNKLTLDTFIEKLYEHFGIIISRAQYREEMNNGNVVHMNDLSFLDKNEKEFAEMLKKCGFLRDLSDATAIVENPY